MGEYLCEKLTERIISAGIEVHRNLGPGLMASAYEQCLCHELYLLGMKFQRQKSLPLVYKGIKLDCSYRLDILIEEQVIVELKTVEKNSSRTSGSASNLSQIITGQGWVDS